MPTLSQDISWTPKTHQQDYRTKFEETAEHDPIIICRVLCILYGNCRQPQLPGCNAAVKEFLCVHSINKCSTIVAVPSDVWYEHCN